MLNIGPGRRPPGWQELCYECSNPISSDATTCPTCDVPQVILKNEMDAAREELDETIWSDIKRDKPRVYYGWVILFGILNVAYMALLAFISRSYANSPDKGDWLINQGVHLFAAILIFTLIATALVLHVQRRIFRSYDQLLRQRNEVAGEPPKHG